MERKKIIPSESKPNRSNILQPNTLGHRNKAEEGKFGGMSLKRNNSKSKLMKTAIVNPFNSAADVKSATEEHLDHAIKHKCNKSSDLDPPTPSTSTERSHTKRESEALKESLDDAIANRGPALVDGHSGIPFIRTPKKLTGPRIFNKEKQKKSIQRFQSVLHSTTSKTSAAETTIKTSALHGKVLPNKKCKAPITNTTTESQNLVELNSTVCKEAPVVMKNFDGHSGISFKPRKSAKTSTNPFASSGSGKSS